MIRLAGTSLAGAVLALLAGCGPDYSPNTYSSAAVQQANKVERGAIVGVRQIDVTAAGVIGAATGGAAGGVAGAQAPGGGIGSAFGAIGGGLVGGIIGNSVEHVTSDTFAFEYIVRKANNELVSVTQKDAVPLKIGTQVLVIAGTQARIVPDYTIEPDPATASAAPAAPPAAAPAQAAPPAQTQAQAQAPSALAPATDPPPAPVAASPLPAPTP